MGLSVDFIVGLISTIVIAILGFFVSRVFSQTDKNLDDLWRSIEKIRERLNDCDGRHDLTEERAKHITERLSALETRTRQ